MKTPKTINGLMRHLRNDCNLEIHGSLEKQQLMAYGYFHGYKGYRFFQKTSNRIPFKSFEEIMAVIEYDNTIKAILYPNLMFIETAVKNIMCISTIEGLSNSSFDYVLKERMNDNTTNSHVQSDRLKLRNSLYSKISNRYGIEGNKDNQMVRHFYDRGEDVPVWVVFELMFLDELGRFFLCLNTNTRKQILDVLNMIDSSSDTNSTILGDLILTIKALRNAVAHNSIVFDARFKDRDINQVVKHWTERDTGIKNITLHSLSDYFILLYCMLKRLDYSNTRARGLILQYKDAETKLQEKVSKEAFDSIISNRAKQKMFDLESLIL